MAKINPDKKSQKINRIIIGAFCAIPALFLLLSMIVGGAGSLSPYEEGRAIGFFATPFLIGLLFYRIGRGKLKKTFKENKKKFIRGAIIGFLVFCLLILGALVRISKNAQLVNDPRINEANEELGEILSGIEIENSDDGYSISIGEDINPKSPMGIVMQDYLETAMGNRLEFENALAENLNYSFEDLNWPVDSKNTDLLLKVKGSYSDTRLAFENFVQTHLGIYKKYHDDINAIHEGYPEEYLEAFKADFNKAYDDTVPVIEDYGKAADSYFESLNTFLDFIIANQINFEIGEDLIFNSSELQDEYLDLLKKSAEKEQEFADLDAAVIETSQTTINNAQAMIGN